jgi:hypothetical protein
MPCRGPTAQAWKVRSFALPDDRAATASLFSPFADVTDLKVAQLCLLGRTGGTGQDLESRIERH